MPRDQQPELLSEATIAALTTEQLRDYGFVHHLQQHPKIAMRRLQDCRDNIMPQVTRELVHKFLDPRNTEVSGRPFDDDGDWYRPHDVVTAVLTRFGTRLAAMDTYYDTASAKVGRILRNDSDPRIERRKYQRNAYLYRYTDSEVVQLRADEAQQEDQERDEAREQAKALMQQADALGIRLDVVGCNYERARVPTADMARLLSALQALVRS